MRRLLLIPILMIWVLGLISVSKADELAANVTDFAVISESDSSRIVHVLTEFDLPEGISCRQVKFATLELNVSVESEEVPFVSGVVYPVTASWNPQQVSWTSPWSNHGGDYNTDVNSVVGISCTGTNALYIDITDLIPALFDQRGNNHGVITILDFDYGDTSLDMLPLDNQRDYYARVIFKIDR
jgi:hypothetical protein